MATYAIGDVQGCWRSLRKLLDLIAFSPLTDRIWLTGDLVNRGPESLAVLRFLSGLGAAAVCVLGNHDLHLLARAAGLAAPKPRDTLEEVLKAPDREALLTWLASRPLLHRERDVVMVHAGLAPDWTADFAAAEARRLEQALRDPARWPGLIGAAGVDPALATLTTLRTCTLAGKACKFSGAPATAPPECLPWFSHPRRRSRDVTVLFGHWASLGLALGPDYAGLDTGCVWGRSLTALRLEDWRTYTVAAAERP